MPPLVADLPEVLTEIGRAGAGLSPRVEREAILVIGKLMVKVSVGEAAAIAAPDLVVTQTGH